MEILSLRILPPLAIGRLGASATPLSAYSLTVSDQKPLDFRAIVPNLSFVVNKETGSLSGEVPDKIIFKEVDALSSKNGKIHPVAPFLEVFAITDEAPDQLVPLNLALLSKAGLSISDISWEVEVGNIKIFRRTNDPDDKIYASLTGINNHSVHPLSGTCENFLPGKTLPLGSVQFISPTAEFPEIRLRFTPAAGKVYGSSLHRLEMPLAPHTGKAAEKKDPVITSEDQLIYDKNKPWFGYSESSQGSPLFTNPAQIFAGYSDADGSRHSWGYLDDECDGFVSVHLKTGTATLIARAHISAGPPAFAPDTLPIRVVSDELEQILLGPEVSGDVSIEEAEDIVRRALESIRLMNTTIMNGNAVNGIFNTVSTMVRQNTNDFGRLYEPIMASSIVDNLALRTLHERVFAGLSTGAAAWFADALRRPDEIGDLSSPMLRKMPALMRGADGRSLTLTHRQINMVIKSAANALFKNADSRADHKNFEEDKLKATNLTAQLHYQGAGNPFSILPRAAISNCFPGLEFDFRNLWRRAFIGIVLMENNNYVREFTEKEYGHLIGCRLVAIDEKPTMVVTTGPTFPGALDGSPLITTTNPNGVSFMEWSNSMADVLQKQGQKVCCRFTSARSDTEVVFTAEELAILSYLKTGDLSSHVISAKDIDNFKIKYPAIMLTVNNFFEAGTSVFSEEIIKPGEMTQGLCAPWQNDYRECACYYWAASRPDFVNVVPDEKGISTGDNWMAKKRTGDYLADNRTDHRLLSYDDLFMNWQGELNFIIKGNDAIES